MCQGHEDIVLLLLEQPGVDIDARSGSAVQKAIGRGKVKIFNSMMSKNIAINAQGSRYGSFVHAAACSGNMQIFKLLLEKRASLNIQGDEFGSAIQAAAFYGRTELANVLLENGANPNTKGGRFGCALNAARKSKVARSVREEMVRLLVAYGPEEYPPSGHELERWVLTPGGWTWLPPDSL